MPEEIVEKVRNPEPGADLMRPDLDILKDGDVEYDCPEYVMGKSNPNLINCSGANQIKILQLSTNLQT